MSEYIKYVKRTKYKDIANRIIINLPGDRTELYMDPVYNNI